MIADLRAVNQHQPYAKLVTVLHALSTKWDQREGKYFCSLILIISTHFSNAALHRRGRRPLQCERDAQASDVQAKRTISSQ